MIRSTMRGQSLNLRSGCKLEPLMPGRSGEMMRMPSSRAGSSVSRAMVRELGQPWQNITGTPFASPYSSKATTAPSWSWTKFSLLILKRGLTLLSLVLQASNL
jgi:hypothetical protein